MLRTLFVHYIDGHVLSATLYSEDENGIVNISLDMPEYCEIMEVAECIDDKPYGPYSSTIYTIPNDFKSIFRYYGDLMNFKRYIHRPIEIEAVKVTNELIQECKSSPFFVNNYMLSYVDDERISIETNHGSANCDLNDWIIKGLNGELYPCRDDLFQQIYAAIDNKHKIELFSTEIKDTALLVNGDKIENLASYTLEGGIGQLTELTLRTLSSAPIEVDTTCDIISVEINGKKYRLNEM